MGHIKSTTLFFTRRAFALITAFSVFTLCFMGSFKFMPSVGVKAATIIQFPDVNSIGGVAIDGANALQIDAMKSVVDTEIVQLFSDAGYISEGAGVSAITDSVVDSVLSDAAAGVTNEATTFLSGVGIETAYAMGLVAAGVGGFTYGAYSEYYKADESIRQQYSMTDCAKMGWRVYRDRWVSAQDYDSFGFIGKALTNFATLCEYVSTAFGTESPLVYIRDNMLHYSPENVASLTRMFDVGDYFIDDVYIAQNPISGVYGSLPAFYNTPVFEQVGELYSNWLDVNGLSGVSPKFTPAGLDSVPTFSSTYGLFNSLATQNSWSDRPSNYTSFMVIHHYFRDPSYTGSGSTTVSSDAYSLMPFSGDLYCYRLTNVPYEIGSGGSSGDALFDPDDFNSYTDTGDFLAFSPVSPSDLSSGYDCLPQLFYSYRGTTHLGAYSLSFDRNWYYRSRTTFAGSTTESFSQGGSYSLINSQNGYVSGYASDTQLLTRMPTYLQGQYFGDFYTYFNATFFEQDQSSRYDSFDGYFYSFFGTEPIPVYEIDFSGSGTPQLINDTPPAPYDLTEPAFSDDGTQIDILGPIGDITDLLIDIRDVLTRPNPPALIDVEPGTDINLYPFLQPIIDTLIDPSTGLSVDFSTGLGGITVYIDIDINVNPTPTPVPLPDFPDVDGIEDYVQGTVNGATGFIAFLGDVVAVLPSDMIVYLWGFLVIAVAGFMVSRFIG